MNSVNFTGAFLIKNPPSEAKKQLNIISGNRKQIFENFNNTTDMFYVVRPSKDKDIANFILQNGLSFKYFPYIGTKSGLDPQYPKNAIHLTNVKQPMISLREFLAKKFNLTEYIPESTELKSNTDGVAKALSLNTNDISLNIKNGITIAFTKDGKHIFKSSPVNKYGENYVYYNDGLNVKKYMILGDRIIHEYPDNATYFHENFKNASLPQIDECI